MRIGGPNMDVSILVGVKRGKLRIFDLVFGHGQSEFAALAEDPRPQTLNPELSG